MKAQLKKPNPPSNATKIEVKKKGVTPKKTVKKVSVKKVSKKVGTKTSEKED